MVLSLIYGRKYAQSKVGTVSFDTMVTEEHRYTSRVTNYPVENGTIVSDHIINQPDVVVLSGLVTDTPLSILAPYNRSVAAFNALIDIHRKRQVVTVVTGIKVYYDMAIVTLDVPRTVKTGQTLTFNIELQKINYINNIDAFLNQPNVFQGVENNTPIQTVSDNSQIPILRNDPPFSLKDQAASPVSFGIQNLARIPTSILPNVLTNATAIQEAT